jgi:hypothetical protein
LLSGSWRFSSLSGDTGLNLDYRRARPLPANLKRNEAGLSRPH